MVHISISRCYTWEDPKSFVRGGPALTTFFLVDEGEDPSTTISDHHQPVSVMPFKWRFTGVPMMSQN